MRDLGGFYDPPNAVYLKNRSNYCAAFHETIHSFSLPDALMTWLGRDLTEGLTQYFTDVVFEEQTENVCHGHKYGPQLECARKFVNTVDFNNIASLFFGDLNKLQVIAQKLGVADKDAMRQLKSDGICKRLK